MKLELLNKKFGLDDALRFRPGPGNLTVAEIRNRAGRALIALHGAQVLEFTPEGEAPVLWLGRHSYFEAGKPIRGGIPVCWPWFGAHPREPAQPAHGFARLSEWEVKNRAVISDQATEITLSLRANEATRARWPHDFQLEAKVTVGAKLTVALTMINLGNQAFPCTAALHSYFNVKDISKIAVRGLEGRAYLDTLNHSRSTQDGPILFTAETDRVYLDTEHTCFIDDPGLNRTIRIAKAGSRSTVVWNPWIEKAKRMPDFGDDEYQTMVCVETANAREDSRTIPPGGRHLLEAEINVEPRS